MTAEPTVGPDRETEPRAPSNWVEALPAYPGPAATGPAGDGSQAVLQPLSRFEAQAVFADRRRIAGRTGSGVAVVDTETGRTVFQREVRGVSAFHRMHVGGGWLALAGGSEGVLLDTNQPPTRVHPSHRIAVSRDGRRLARQSAISLAVADADAPTQWNTLVEGGVRGPTALQLASDGSWLLAEVRTGLERIDIASEARTPIVDAPNYGSILTPDDHPLVPTEGGLRRFTPQAELLWTWSELPDGEVRLSTDATGTLAIVEHRESVTLLDLESGAVRGQYPPLRGAFVMASLGALVGVRWDVPRLAAYRLLDGEPLPLPTEEAIAHVREVDATRVLVSGEAHFGLLDLHSGEYSWRRGFASSARGVTDLQVLAPGGIAMHWGRTQLTWRAQDRTPSLETREVIAPAQDEVVFENDAGRARVRGGGLVLELGGREVVLENARRVQQLFAAGRRWLASVDDDEGRPQLLILDARRGVLQTHDLANSAIHVSTHTFLYRENYSREWFVANRRQALRHRSLGRRALVGEGAGIVAVLQDRTITLHGAAPRPSTVPVPGALPRPTALHVLDDGRLLLESRERASVLSPTDGALLADGAVLPGGPWPRIGTRYVGCYGTMRVVEVGGEPRDVGPCLSHSALSPDGRYLVGLREDAVRVVDLDRGRTLTLHVERREDAITVAVADDTGRVDQVGPADATPVAVREGRVESGAIRPIETPRTEDLFRAWWSAR